MLDNQPHAVAPFPGYEHWDRNDMPGYGVGGLLPEQRLWHQFHLECVIRQLVKFQEEQASTHHSISAHINRVKNIPVGR
jgi:hypothetical protein